MAERTPLFAVGQEVILDEPGYKSRRQRPVTITKVGRLYAYIDQYGMPRGFNLFDGYEQGTAYGNSSRLVTPEILAAEARRAAVLDRLKSLGIELRHGQSRDYSIDALEAVATILEADRA